MLLGIKNKIKNSGIFGKSSYGKTWNEKNGIKQQEWYSHMHECHSIQHEDFKNYLKTKKDVQTILEVGCGTGVYPIKFKDLFSNMKYTGIDFSKTAIEQCKKNSEFEFICGDFIKITLPTKYDLVYSHAVIDHVYDMDAFIVKVVDVCKKYAYVTAYRGYFPDLSKHKINWNDNDGCYYNDLSIKQIKEKFSEIGLKENQYKIRSIQIAQTGKDTDWQTIIEINKKT